MVLYLLLVGRVILLAALCEGYYQFLGVEELACCDPGGYCLVGNMFEQYRRVLVV